MRSKFTHLKTILVSSALAALLSSCGPEFSVEVKEFMKTFSFTKCIEKYLVVDYHLSSVVKENDSITSSRDQVVSFDLSTDIYSYSYETHNSGDFISDSNPESKIENYIYDATSEKYTHTLIVNEKSTTDSVDKVVVRGKVTSFFGEEYAESGLYTNGIYYGDQVKNMISMHNYFSVDYERNLLIFDLKDQVIEKSLASLHYEVNSDGMLVAWNQTIDDGVKLLTSEITIDLHQ